MPGGDVPIIEVITSLVQDKEPQIADADKRGGTMPSDVVYKWINYSYLRHFGWGTVKKCGLCRCP